MGNLPQTIPSMDTTLTTTPQNHFLMVEDEQSKRIIPLESSTYSIGRDPENAIQLQSRWVSRQHALLLRVTLPGYQEYAFRVIDGDLQGKRSTNGLIVNGHYCYSQDLQHGDHIVFGRDTTARYYITQKQLDEGFLRQLMNASDQELTELDLESESTFISAGADTHQVSETALVRLASFPELVPHPIIEIDTQGNLTYTNPAAVRQFPTLPRERLAHPLLQGIIPRLDLEQPPVQKYLAREVAIGDLVFEQFVHYLRESDLIRIHIVDITSHKQTEEALRRSEAKNRALLNAIPDLMLHLNVEGQILDFKAARDYPLPTSPDQLLQKSVAEFLPSRVAQKALFASRRALQTRETQLFEYELEVEGKLLYYEARVVVISDDEMLAIVRNVSERKLFEQQLLHDALHDALTGLPNRNWFMNRLGHAIDLAKRRPEFQFAVLFIDLDRFKVVNDSLGHVTGDHLLVHLARRLEACLRTGDTVARMGGDEFAVLLETITGVEDAKRVAERIQQSLNVPFKLGNHEVFTTASIGIAPSIIGYERPEEPLRDADTAMYQAKSQGKSRYAVFNRAMHARMVALLELDNDLRRALERREFFLQYQPIVNLASGRISGFEALVRWEHPQRGTVSPSEFINLAEETGLIVTLGDWILNEACRQLKQWQALDNWDQSLTLNVNLSARQFTRPYLIEEIKSTLEQHGIQPANLKLELTESTLMENSANSQEILNGLQDLGIQICIDDFGTGYSSLSYLHRLPVSVLKADRAFVSNMHAQGDNCSLEITRTIILLARNLEIDVVAEGVETEQQLAQLRELGCAYGQGYLFSRPMASQDIEALLSSQPKW